MREHKKLYKAGKTWVTATILTVSVAASGLYLGTSVHADAGEQVNGADSYQSTGTTQSSSDQSSSDVTEKREQLEQQVQQAQADVNQKEANYNNAKTTQDKASKELTKIGGEWARNQRYVRQYKNYAPTTIELYNKTDTQLSTNYNQLLNEYNEMESTDAQKLYDQYFQKWNDAYNKMQQMFDNKKGNYSFSEQEQALIQRLDKEREEYNAKLQELKPLRDQGNKARDKVYADYQAAYAKWENLGIYIMRISQS